MKDEDAVEPVEMTHATSRSGLFNALGRLLLTMATLGIIRPLKASASGCSAICNGMFNYKCFQPVQFITASYEPCGNADFNVFAELEAQQSALAGYIDFNELTMVAGCMTYDSSYCRVGSC